MRNGTDSMRVLQVAARYFPYMGGMETHVYEIGRRLVRAGHEVTVLTTDVTGRLPASEVLEGVQIRRISAWPAGKDYYFAPDLYRIITQGKWDLVHCQGYHNLVPPLAMLAALRTHVPYVLSFHSAGHSSRFRNALRHLQRSALRPLLSHAMKLICVSKFEAEFFRERLRLPAEQFVVIPNGAQLALETGLSTEPVKDERGSLIVSVGRLERYKGHHRVIAALPIIRESVPDVHLRILGTGPYEQTLLTMAKKLGVADRVEIQAIPPGDRNAMATAIARANLVTLLSEHEAQPIAVLEALALKRPVLVADTSGMQEFAASSLARAIPLKSTAGEVAAAVISQLRDPLIPTNAPLPTWDDCATQLLTLYQTIVRGSSCVF
jgi:glycosyltransferase involved in cell wall biosynthesis